MTSDHSSISCVLSDATARVYGSGRCGDVEVCFLVVVAGAVGGHILVGSWVVNERSGAVRSRDEAR